MNEKRKELGNLETMSHKDLVYVFASQKREEVYVFHLRDFVRVRDAIHEANMTRPIKRYRSVMCFKKHSKKFSVKILTGGEY